MERFREDYRRRIISLDATNLELFVRSWVIGKEKIYHEVTTLSGSSDLGRDVVGFLTKDRHEGLWHNYQCKQYRERLPTATAIHEIGKMFYYAHNGEFSVPDKYYFVAPMGVNRNLERLIFNPSQFKDFIIDKWDEYCAETIVEGTIIPLTLELKSLIESYDFSNVIRLNVDDLLDDPYIIPVLYKWFGADPGPAPDGITPEEVHDSESPYITQLLDAYGQRESCLFSNYHDIVEHPEHCEHLKNQRERYYHADAFKRFYRDNTSQELISNFERDIYHGVVDTCNSKHDDALYRVNAVMSQAAQITPSGILAKHAGVPVKQGICHHYANEGKLKWKK